MFNQRNAESLTNVSKINVFTLNGQRNLSDTTGSRLLRIYSHLEFDISLDYRSDAIPKHLTVVYIIQQLSTLSAIS